MAIVDGSLGSLVQGVSQQPSRARLHGQSEEQINVTNDEVFGMSRRASTEYVASIDKFPDGAEGPSWAEHGHFRMGTQSLRYTFRVTDIKSETAIKLLKDGTEYNVVLDDSSQEYLRTARANNPYGRRVVFKEMDDKVFVLNTQHEVKIKSGVLPYGDKDATVVYCRGGKYANSYTIRIKSGSTEHFVSYMTPDGSVSAHTKKANARFIMKQLRDIIHHSSILPENGATAAQPEWIDSDNTTWVGEPGLYYSTENAKVWIQANFHTKMVGEHLVFTPQVTGFDYTITSTESSGTELLVDIRDDIKNVGRLPTRAPAGKVVRVVGSNRAEDDYFLRWIVQDVGNSITVDEKGVWEECTAPKEDYRLDPATMPHELYLDNGEYKMRQMDWGDRTSGSNESNPFPKFVGQTIQDIADFQGRAAFVHGSSVSLSQSDEYMKWFKTTATTKLATDPIHLRSTATKGDSKLVYAVPFNRDLVVFGTNNSQYMITGRTTLTTDNATMVLTSEFDSDLGTRPQALGDSIMFLSWTGKFTHVHEMYLEGDQNNHARRTVTDHVPRFLPGRARVFAANDGGNVAVVVTNDDPNTAYLYEYLWIDGRRVQSSWSKWTFDTRIESLRINEGELAASFRSLSGGYIVTNMPLYRKDMEDQGFPIHMDYTQEVTLADQDTIRVVCSGYSESVDTVQVVAMSSVDGVSVAGMPVGVESVTSVPNSAGIVNQCDVRLKRNFTGKLLVGTRFKTRFVPTMPVLRDGDGVAITQAEVSVAEFNITCEKTGPFQMIRECQYERPEDYWKQVYSGATLGDPDFVLGTAPIDSTVVPFWFDDLTTTSKLVVECDSHLPMTLTEIEWNGTVRNRYKRITNGGR